MRFDKAFYEVKEREIAKVDTIAQGLVSKSDQVASLLAIGEKSGSLLMVSLPQNKVTPAETTGGLSWAYWIGVGQEGHLAIEANRQSYLLALGGLVHLSGSPIIG